MCNRHGLVPQLRLHDSPKPALLGAIIAYGIGSMLVYFVMLSLGELSVAMPYAGSFHLYAKRFIGPGTAFTIAVLYWLNWAVALASEFYCSRSADATLVS